MQQFNNSDHSGMVGFLVGIVVLVFTGIVFSLMADKRFRFSSAKISLEEKIAEEKHDLETIKSRLESSRKHWRDNGEPLASQKAAAQAASDSVKDGVIRLAALREEKEATTAAIASLAASIDDYRIRYRQQVRAAATGERLAELKTRDGRVYKEVTIRKVSATGIEIRHEQGNAGLPPEDLDPAWHERFQWTREEVAKAQGEERVRQERQEQALGEPTGGNSAPKPNKAEERLRALRQEVIDTRNRYRTAQGEASRARIEAGGSGRDRSVPGSLETWAQRATRLETTATKLRSQYITARTKLAAQAPGDALLKVEEP